MHELLSKDAPRRWWQELTAADLQQVVLHNLVQAYISCVLESGIIVHMNIAHRLNFHERMHPSPDECPIAPVTSLAEDSSSQNDGIVSIFLILKMNKHKLGRVSSEYFDEHKQLKNSPWQFLHQYDDTQPLRGGPG